ncbi:hypothetical protein SESBI_02103 [Sesbania bispinosa]|nr:hypothetical protein SESBI_02103 [Sesbania bispinosa]
MDISTDLFLPLSIPPTRILSLVKMPKKGESFIPQMDAKALKAFSRSGKRKQFDQSSGVAADQNVVNQPMDNEVSSTTISEKTVPKRTRLPSDPTPGSEGKNKGAEGSHPEESNRMTLVAPSSPKWWQWFQGYEGKAGTEVHSLFDRRFPTGQFIENNLNKSDDRLRVNKSGLINTSKIAQSFCLQGAFVGYALETGITLLEKELIEKNDLLKGQETEIAQARLASTELENLRKKVEELALMNDRLKADLTECEKEKTKSTTAMEQQSSLLKEAEEKLRVSEESLTAEKAGRKADIDNLKAEISFQYENGFDKAMEQLKFLQPDLNVEGIGPFMEKKDGKLVDIPDDEE